MAACFPLRLALALGLLAAGQMPVLAQQPAAPDAVPYATGDVVLDPNEPAHGHPGRRFPYIHRALRDLGRARKALDAAPAGGPLGIRKPGIIKEVDDAIRQLEKATRTPASKLEKGVKLPGKALGEAHPDLVRAHRNLKRAVLALAKAPASENLGGLRIKVLKRVRALETEVGKGARAK
ncbi:MAG: hypothetical protein VKP57_10990 [Candidatus Sericytochromatia bacterium]|nr:hypothetical protein [Candidatus Sericytochromatia bacterium]